MAYTPRMNRCPWTAGLAGLLCATLLSCATTGPGATSGGPKIMTEGRSLNLRVEDVNPPTGPGVGYSLAATSKTPERRFITVRPRDGEAYPAILEASSTTGEWKRVILSDPGLPGYGWEFVGPVGETNALFGVLDSGPESPAYELVILGSPDYGATWFERSRLRKPDAKARVEAVTVDVFGNGRISLRLDWADDLDATIGHYHFDTKDGGQTFAAPVFEPFQPGP